MKKPRADRKVIRVPGATGKFVARETTAARDPLPPGDASRVVVDPEIMLGKPVIRGTRVTVELLLRRLAEGASQQDILAAYPHFTPEDVHAALAYAADVVAHEDTMILRANASTRR